MADNNTQYKIDFNGKEMILNDSDLKSIRELLLSKHSGLNDKRKAAYETLLNDYLTSITQGKSFDLSSYNYGDSKPIFRNQRDNAVKYDLLSELNRRSKQQSSNQQQSTLNEQDLAQYNVLTNRLSNITFFNNDSEENVNRNLALIKDNLKKVEGLNEDEINGITDANSFITFMNNNIDKLNEDPDNVETLASYLTLKKPEPNPNEGKTRFENTNIYYNPSLGEYVKQLITPDNQLRYLYNKYENGKPSLLVVNENGETVPGQLNTVFGHYFDNGKAKLVMEKEGDGFGVYDYNRNNIFMNKYNQNFNYLNGKISQYQAGTQQDFNYILNGFSGDRQIPKGQYLDYVDITGLIDGLENNKHVFLIGNEPLYFGNLQERDAYIYDEKTDKYESVKIRTDGDQFVIKDINNENDKGTYYNRNFTNTYDPLKFLSKYNFGIDASKLSNIKVDPSVLALYKDNIDIFINNFKNLNIDLEHDIKDSNYRNLVRKLFYILKKNSNERNISIEEVLREKFGDKGSKYIENLIERIYKLMTDLKVGQKDNSSSSSSASGNSGSIKQEYLPFKPGYNNSIDSKKYGGVLKYALGAEISNQLANATIREDKLPTEEELNQLEQEYLNSMSPRYKRKLQEGYLPINGSGTAEHQWNAHDTADIVAGGMDLASLMGGLPGIILSGAALVTDLVNQATDDRYTKADVWKNLGLNIGFMLLSAIPGAASVKFAKNAQKAHKQLKTVEKFIRNSETGKKLLEKAGPEAVNKLIKATEESLQSKELKSLWLEKMASKGERAINAGGAAIGLYAGYEGVKSAAEDIREHRGVSTTSVRQMVGGLAGGLSLGRGVERLAIRRVTEPVTGVSTTTSIGNSIDVGINKSKLNEAEREFIKFKKGDQQFFDEDGKLYLDTSNISNREELKEALLAKKEEIKKSYEEKLLEEVEAPSDGSPKVLSQEYKDKKKAFDEFIDNKVKTSPKTFSLLKQKAKNKATEAKESFKQTIRGDFDERYPRQLKSQEDLDNMIFLRHLGEWRARKRGYVNPQDGLSSSQERRVNNTLENLLKEVVANDKKKPEGERQFSALYNQEQNTGTPKVEGNTNTTSQQSETTKVEGNTNVTTQQQETPKIEGNTTATTEQQTAPKVEENNTVTTEQPATTKPEENANVTQEEQKAKKENKLSKLFNDSFKKLQSIAEKLNPKSNKNIETSEPKINSKPSDWGGKQKEFDNYVQSILSKITGEDKEAKIKTIIAHFEKRKDKKTNQNIQNILDNLTKLQKNEEIDVKNLAYEIANATAQNIANRVGQNKMTWSNARMFQGGGSIIGEDKTKDKKEKNVDLTALAQIPEMLLALSVNRKNREGLNIKAPKIDKVEYYTPVFDNFALTQYYQKQADNIMRQAELQASQYSDPSIRERIMSSAQKQVQQLSDKAAMENVYTFNKSKSEQINNTAKLAMQNNEIDYKNKQINYKNKLQEEQLNAAERIKNYESAITGLKELKHNMFLTKQQSDQMRMADKKLELSLSYQNEYKQIVAKYSDAGKDILKQFQKNFPNGDINSEDGNRKMFAGKDITYKQAYDKAVNDAKQQMKSELLDLKFKYERLNNHTVVPTNPNQYTIDLWAKGGSLSFNEKMQLERQKRIHNQIKHNLEIAKENEKRLRNQIDPAVNSLNKERLLVLNSILKG